jgi:rod shape-determining protein MreD
VRSPVLHRLDTIARNLLPAAVTLAVLLAGVIPLHIAALQAVSPALLVIVVFYWTLYRPDLLPAVAVFLIGSLQDILMGLPIGVSACVLIGVHAAVTTQRRFFPGRSFEVVWLGFAIVATAALIFGWLLTCAYYLALIAPEKLAFQIVTTIGFFPIFCRVLRRCRLSLPERA